MTQQKKEDLDKDLKAISTIINALNALEGDERIRVLNYVLERMDIQLEKNNIQPFPGSQNSIEQEGATTTSERPSIFKEAGIKQIMDIKTLRGEKQPSTGIQMAVLVAYYLQELASEGEKANSIGKEEMEKYFKQAQFKLPAGDPINTLNNAKNAGYLDSSGEWGKFKLSPVGYNLVAHNLPQKEKTQAKRKVKKTNKPVAKKIVAKKK